MEGKAPSRASGVEDSGNTGAGGYAGLAAVRHEKGGEGSRALQRELCRGTKSGVVPKASSGVSRSEKELSSAAIRSDGGGKGTRLLRFPCLL